MTPDPETLNQRPQAPDNLVEVRGVHFTLGERVIYKAVDLDIARGRITAIMGPSGTGKTTLLRLISGQWRPGKGTVHFDGAHVAKLSQNDLFEQRKRMGMLFQSGALLTDLSVFDNVAFPLREHTKLPEPLIRDIVLMKLEAVGLRGARALYPAQLSGGMARRVALARAIALDPEMIMYDEPFAGQDPISMGVLLRLIRRLNDVLGLTSIVVSHDVKETLGIADYVYVISDGEVIDHGTPEQIRDSSSKWVQQFIHAEADGPVPFHYQGAPYADDLLNGSRR
ncbi:ABC transporter, ATP-binding protein YrbF [Salinisphaera dokdonensis CL-ES53]|uniref:ABC transporter, ATP-binding protein YrbF n=1 Tax=Salinisphaera dokdonensis CL-ES53 TaxID=1304272 RepID=A0ABV2B0T0_9GAMM